LVDCLWSYTTEAAAIAVAAVDVWVWEANGLTGSIVDRSVVHVQQLWLWKLWNASHKLCVFGDSLWQSLGQLCIPPLDSEEEEQGFGFLLLLLLLKRETSPAASWWKEVKKKKSLLLLLLLPEEEQ
jgi:hypothetical protein